MKVLLIGTGGVGEAIAIIAQDKPWLKKMVLADYNTKRLKEVSTKLNDPKKFPVERLDARDKKADRRTGARLQRRSDHERGRSGLQRDDLRRRLQGARPLHGHGDDAVQAASDRSVREDRRQAGRLSIRARGQVGEEGTAGARRAWASSRAWPMCSPSMPRSISSTRSTRSACATERTSKCAATPSRPTSRSGRRSKNA